MSRKPRNPALNAAITGSLLLAAPAFASTPLAQGYLLGADQAGHAHHARSDGSPSGPMKFDADKDGRVTRQEFLAGHARHAEEMFGKLDTDKDGAATQTEVQAHLSAMGKDGKCGCPMCAAGKTGEGRCGAAADKKAGEGKCGEGKCGEGKCGSR